MRSGKFRVGRITSGYTMLCNVRSSRFSLSQVISG